MPRKRSEIEELIQEIKVKMEEPLAKDPRNLRHFFTSNFFQRTLSHLFGRTIRGEVKAIRVADDGTVFVTPYGGAFDQYEVYTGTTADDYTPPNTHEFDEAVKRVDLLIEDADVIVAFMNPAAQWMDNMIIKQGFWSFDVLTKGIKLKSRTSGSPASYQIVAWI